MANDEHVAILRRGLDAWIEWRRNYPVRVDLSDASLAEEDFSGADFSGADLSGADLSRAAFESTDFSGADLSGAVLVRSNFTEAVFTGANLKGAYLTSTDLTRANFTGANLSGADLEDATMVGTDFTGADLTGSRVHGASAWDLKLAGAKQQNVVITSTASSEPEITVDNIEVAQFIYLLLHNEKIRDVIDTITSKAVLILGRFTPERKKVLDAIREELRNRELLPILFDFEKPDSKDLTGTVQTLANMARFIIADLTDPSCIPHELAMVVPGTVVPVQPVLLQGQHEYAMFVDLKRRYGWVLEPYVYESQEQLIADLLERVIRPAETRVLELRGPPKQ